MDTIKRAALAAAVFLAFATPAGAESVAKSSKPAPKAAPRAVKPAATPTVEPSAEDANRSLPAQVVYQVLLGELAMQRGNVDLAVGAYADLANRTRDPKVLERATELATYGRRFDVAYELGRLWVEIEPQSTSARQTLVAVLILQGRADELGPQIAYLLDTDKENLVDNLMRLNRMLARFPDKAAAHVMLRRVLQPYAGLAEAHYALATSALHAGERAVALTEIRRAQELRPTWEQAALFEAQLAARESTAAGLGVLERFVAANPSAHEVRLQLARGLVAEKRYDEAHRHFRKLLDDSPDNPELTYPVAVLALQQNDIATAEPLLRKVLARGEPAERNVAAYYLGQLAEDKGALTEAADFYRQVTAGEQLVPAQVRVGHLLLRQGGGMAMARQYLQEAARRLPAGKTQFLLAEAQLLREAGRGAEALELLDTILAEQPDQTDVLYDTAMLAEKLDRMDIVESRLRRVIALRPDSAHAYNALGYSFADRGVRIEEARDLIAKALELAPDDPFILDSMGWVQHRLGDNKAALGYLERAYRIRPDAEIAAHLGEVLWLLDRRDEARRIWREAAGRFPGNDMLDAVRRKYPH